MASAKIHDCLVESGLRRSCVYQVASWLNACREGNIAHVNDVSLQCQAVAFAWASMKRLLNGSGTLSCVNVQKWGWS